MNFIFQKIVVCLAATILLASTVESHAFALLGPFAPWMQATNGVIQSGDIGGPMDIGSGYRWNVPVVTYGFDKSFLDYFGTNGVAAVQSAIQIINDLPPASSLVPTNFPFDTQSFNYTAQAQALYDLKSQTLVLLLEHLGLAQPSRNIFVMKQWTSAFSPANYPSLYFISTNAFLSQSLWPDWFIPNFIAMRNFDPQTLTASQYVNDSLYTAYVQKPGGIAIVPVDPYADSYSAVADIGNSYNLNSGEFFTGLTYDDVGGLAYLLSTNNVNYETLLPNIIGIGANSNSFVNGAWRPGMDKITFIPQPVDLPSGALLPTTNYFTDNYLTNGVLHHQQMARTISKPDFLFSAGDVTLDVPALPFFARTGTTNWLNNAAANGNTNGEGPGVIQPQVQIVFNKLGQQFSSFGSYFTGQDYDQSQFWASFDNSTNEPIIYPIPQAGTNQMTVRMWLTLGRNIQKNFEWKPSSLPGAQFTMQTSTDLINWATLFTVANNSSVCTYFNNNPPDARRFYRLIPQ